MPCPCPGCTTPDAAVERTAANTLNVKCHRCSFSGYGKPGTRAHRLIEAATTLDAEDAEPSASKPPAAPAPAPAARGAGLLIGG